MQYSTFDSKRYLPDFETAMRLGDASYRSIADMFGPDKDIRVLEIGCGSGNLLLALRARGYANCCGVDSDTELVDHGRNVLGANIQHNDWKTYLENEVRVHDVIIVLDVLEHIPVVEVAYILELTRRRLAPCGKFIMRMPNALCPFVLPIFCGDISHHWLTTPKTLTHLLRKAGFDGSIKIMETRPSGGLKRIAFSIVHQGFIKPVLGLMHYHFHGEFPSHLTPNIVCCAHVPD